MTRSIIYKYVAGAALLGLLFAGQAAAVSATQVRADIPFAFQAAGKTMPAGRYLIMPGQAWGTAQVLGENGQAALMRLEIPAGDGSSVPNLIFDASSGTPKLTAIRNSAPNPAKVRTPR
jgi:hypothetical protein